VCYKQPAISYLIIRRKFVVMTAPQSKDRTTNIRQLRVTRLVTPAKKRKPVWGLCVDEGTQETDELHGQEIYFHLNEGKVVTYQPGSSFSFGADDKACPAVGEVIIVEVVSNTREEAQYRFKARRWGRLPITRIGSK
jgi:hypothetical protein